MFRYMKQSDSCQKGGVGNGMKDSEGINHITFVYNSRTLTRTFMYNPREGEDGAGWWWRKEEKAGTT